MGKQIVEQPHLMGTVRAAVPDAEPDFGSCRSINRRFNRESVASVWA